MTVVGLYKYADKNPMDYKYILRLSVVEKYITLIMMNMRISLVMFQIFYQSIRFKRTNM